MSLNRDTRILVACEVGLRADTPILRAIDALQAFETPDSRWLRERGPAIARDHAEMMAEREQDRRCPHGPALSSLREARP